MKLPANHVDIPTEEDARMKLERTATALSVVLAGLVLGGCAGPPVDVQIARELYDRPAMTIAVLPFEQSEPSSDHQETLWRDTAVRDAGALVSDMFTTELMRAPRFKLVERSRIKTILDEQDLSLSQLLAKRSAQEIGNLLGVDAVVLGTVAEFRNGNTAFGSSWTIYSYSMRMVDTKTGIVLISTQTSEQTAGYDVAARCRENVRAVVDRILEKIKSP